ncbi:TniB family NTP-binding protein [Pseudomonas sp. SWRI100]|uniref:TniB family NTP-binding protein n=1 Tax=Pseudomonas TaxID=286 RepID=UPI001648C2F5|nr:MULTISPECIES: TniB family NTP-binding protein [Pseudomonas]MBC3495708.1 TniB family NTP-binding protein [Pseudomonas sp. SWRI67]MBV4526816.1 TniB family NTP-binding protein [Pseudomonas kermanshahensis]
MNHLSDKTRELLSLPAEERALACMRELFLMHPSAMAAELSAQRLVALPRCTSNPGMSLIAHAGLGKSLLGQRWQTQSFKSDSNWSGKVIYIDLVENIANPNVMKLFLAELGKQFYKRPLTLSYRDVALAQQLIRKNNVRCVFIDETPLLKQALSKMRFTREFGAIKGLAGPSWQMNVILSGTEDGFADIYDDATILTRFSLRASKLTPWENDFEGESFVNGYMCYMPLMQKSVINGKLLKKLYESARTTTVKNGAAVNYCSRRAVVEILREACRLEIESGQEYINEKSISKAWKKMQGVNEALARLETRPVPLPQTAPLK